MERHFDDELKLLNENLLKQAALTEKAIHRSIEALKKQDKVLAESVIQSDEEIDEMEIVIEEQTIDLLARFQPMAKDLRFITTGMKINSELEQIADLAVNICQRCMDLADKPMLKPLIDIPKLAENSKQMVKMAIDAFVARDEEMAEEVILSDRKSNDLRTLIVNELIHDYMVPDGTTAPRAVSLMLVARDLERISDHACAIAEDIIYMIKAKMVKHHIKEMFNNQLDDVL